MEKASKSIIATCAHPDCKNPVKRTPWEVANNKHLYCCRSCANMINPKKPEMYSPEQKQFLADQSFKITRKELAKHFNLSDDGLKSLVSRLRKEGYKVGVFTPEKAPEPVKVKPEPKQKGENSKVRIVAGEHMKKELVGTGAFAHPDRIYATRHVEPGKIKVRFKRGNTEVSANDAEHVDRIIKQYSELLGGAYTIIDPENILGDKLEAVGMTPDLA